MLSNPRILETAFTKFESGVARLLKRNGIKTAPQLLIEEEVHIGRGQTPAAYIINPEDPLGAIQMNAKLAATGESPIAMGAYAHEAGHLIADHKVGIGLFSQFADFARKDVPYAHLMDTSGNFFQKCRSMLRFLGAHIKDQQNLINQYKGQEAEADRLMAHLTGSKETAMATRKSFSPGSEMFEEMMGTQGASQLAPKAFLKRRLYYSSARKLNGTAAENAANIGGVNLNDREWVERLITEREARIAASDITKG